MHQYRCDGYAFAARFEGDRALLITGESIIVLSRVRSASGARFVSGDIMLWTKGSEARLEVDGLCRSGCRKHQEPSIPATTRLDGALFRAQGNEPGWYLVMNRDGRARLVANYGELEFQTRVSDPVHRGAATVYEGSRNFRLEIAREPCRDSMRGDLWPAGVTVTLGLETWKGCGMFFSRIAGYRYTPSA